jgi:hypothetical protein
MSSEFHIPQKLTLAHKVFFAVMGLLIAVEVYLGYLAHGMGDADLYIWGYFMRDLSSGSFNWQDWTLPASGYLFPCLASYSLCWVFCLGNSVLALVLQMILYAWTFAILLKSVLRRLLGWDRPDSWLAALGLTLILANTQTISWGLEQGLLLPQSHGGATLVMLLGILVLHSYWRKGRARTLIALGILTALGSFGDKIFILWFVGGAGLIALIHRRWTLMGTLVVSTALGATLVWWITPTASAVYMPNGNWRLIAENTSLRGLPAFWRDLRAGGASFNMCMVALVGTVIGGLSLWKNRRKLPWWSWGAIWIAAVPLAISIIAQTYESPDNWRHFPFTLLIPLVLLLAALKQISHHWKAVFICASLGLLAIELLYFVRQNGAFSDLYTGPFRIIYRGLPQPKTIDDIEFIHSQLHLKDGLATYWISKQVTLQSKDGVFLAPIWRDGRIVPCMTTLRDFEAHHFNYVLTDNLITSQIISHFGPPQKILEVIRKKDRYRILVYPDGFLDKALAHDETLLQIKKDRHLQ